MEREATPTAPGEPPIARGGGALRWGAVAALLLVGGASTAYATCGVWQLGALVGDVLVDGVGDRVGAARRASLSLTPRAPVPPAPPPASSELARPTGPAPAPDQPAVGAVAARAPESDIAEASEKAVPIGLEPPEPVVPAPCDDIFVYIVSIAEGDPQLSSASLGVGKTSPARFRQPGHLIGDWEVVSINDDWSGTNPDVWLRQGSSMCRAELAGNPARVHASLPSRAKKATKKRAKQRAKRGRRRRR